MIICTMFKRNLELKNRLRGSCEYDITIAILEPKSHKRRTYVTWGEETLQRHEQSV